MRFIENEGRWRRLELSPDDVKSLGIGASIGDGEGLIVTVVPDPVVRTWSLRTEHCSSCDRPEVCALIKERSGPCGRNKHIGLREQGYEEVKGATG